MDELSEEDKLKAASFRKFERGPDRLAAETDVPLDSIEIVVTILVLK
jgi:hypothetical protein